MEFYERSLRLSLPLCLLSHALIFLNSRMSALADEIERLMKIGINAKDALAAAERKEAAAAAERKAAAAERKEAAEREFELKRLQLQGTFYIKGGHLFSVFVCLIMLSIM